MMSDPLPAVLADAYSAHRSFLWSLSYRMTGSAADADDVVQDAFVRAMEHPPNRLDEPLRPWLVKVSLNLAKDVLRRRHRQEYPGPWLPSPVPTDEDPPSHEPTIDGIRTLEGRYDLLESVSFAFLLALEALTPSQRAVLLLRDVFDYSVKETADALDLSEPNVKTTHHRARKAMATYDAARKTPSSAVRQQTGTILMEFLRRLERHDVAGIAALLAEDVRTISDGGGEFVAARRPIDGRDKVARFWSSVTEDRHAADVQIVSLNGLPAAIVEAAGPKPGESPRFVMQVEINDRQQILRVYVVSATRKLTAALAGAAGVDGVQRNT